MYWSSSLEYTIIVTRTVLAFLAVDFCTAELLDFGLLGSARKMRVLSFAHPSSFPFNQYEHPSAVLVHHVRCCFSELAFVTCER